MNNLTWPDVWWPGIDADIEKEVLNYSICQRMLQNHYNATFPIILIDATQSECKYYQSQHLKS